jgi:hypothetical protein
MELSPSWVDAGWAATQEPLNILWNSLLLLLFRPSKPRLTAVRDPLRLSRDTPVPTEFGTNFANQRWFSVGIVSFRTKIHGIYYYYYCYYYYYYYHHHHHNDCEQHQHHYLHSRHVLPTELCMKHSRQTSRRTVNQSINDVTENEMWAMHCPNTIRRRIEPNSYLTAGPCLSKIDERYSFLCTMSRGLTLCL